MANKRKTLIIGHRGMGLLDPGSNYGENSIGGFLAALDADVGADGIELDVRLSSDGEVVIHHDALLGRSTIPSAVGDETAVCNITGNELGLVSLKPDSRASIPTLAESLDAIEPVIGEKEVWIELKSLGSSKNEKTLVSRVLEIAVNHPLWPRICFISFSKPMLSLVRAKYSDARLILLARARFLKSMKLAEKLGFDGVGIHHLFAWRWVVRRAGKKNLRLIVGMPNSRRNIRRMLRVGVDAICTDCPEMAAEMVAHETIKIY